MTNFILLATTLIVLLEILAVEPSEISPSIYNLSSPNDHSTAVKTDALDQPLQSDRKVSPFIAQVNAIIRAGNQNTPKHQAYLIFRLQCEIERLTKNLYMAKEQLTSKFNFCDEKQMRARGQDGIDYTIDQRTINFSRDEIIDLLHRILKLPSVIFETLVNGRGQKDNSAKENYHLRSCDGEDNADVEVDIVDEPLDDCDVTLWFTELSNLYSFFA